MSEHSYTGAVIEERRFSGATSCVVLHPPHQRIDAHAHDWPVITFYRIGNYREETEHSDGVVLDGPSVVFHPAGAAHADRIGDAGLETAALSFDPRWLGADARRALPANSMWLTGAEQIRAARHFFRTCGAPAPDDDAVRDAAARFVLNAFSGAEQRVVPPPPWVDRVHAAFEADTSTADVARALVLHPAWVARAYRAWRGEGVAETARRRRVERAVLMLRSEKNPLADIAAACGFCDQSHMNRAFRAVLGRTPLRVRGEAALLAGLL